MFMRLNYLATNKHIFTLLALGLVLAVCSDPVRALEAEVGSRPNHPWHGVPYKVIDDPDSSLPPGQLSFPFYIYICDFQGDRPGFSMGVRVDADYGGGVDPGGKNNDRTVHIDEEGIRILEAYGKIRRDRWDNPSANDGTYDIILKNWDDCVNYLDAFAKHYALGSPYVFYEGYTPYYWYWSVEPIELKSPWKDCEVASRPENVLKLPVDELRDFLTGQGKWTGWNPPKQGPDK